MIRGGELNLRTSFDPTRVAPDTYGRDIWKGDVKMWAIYRQMVTGNHKLVEKA